MESPEPFVAKDFLEKLDRMDENFSFFESRLEKMFVDSTTRLLMYRGKNGLQMVLPDCLRRTYLHSAHNGFGHISVMQV